ncbi:AMP-binding protein [Streptomyces luteireticuli]|uniref:Long-chain fatty acid--CoA ligase n=1 Tax=Streptomyces luteireticuli TaxID=173858 RepID=A0ABP3I3I4_9ACTN
MLTYSVGSLIERCGLAHGSDVAVVSGDRRITYHEQVARIRQTGRALLELGLRKGDRVVLLMGDRPELLDVHYGILWAGLAIVPMNAKAGAADLAFVVNDCGARAVVHEAASADRVHVARAGTSLEFALCVDAEGVLDGGAHLGRLAAKQPDSPGLPEVHPGDRYGILYTGGANGRPKGAEHSHGTFLSAVFGGMAELGLQEQARFAHVAPLTHVGGMFVLPTWLQGGTNVLLGRFDADRLARTIAAERITTTMMVPTMLYALLDSLENGRQGVESLSTVIYGVSPMRRDRLMQAMDTFGPVLMQMNGQVEAPNQVTVLRKSDHRRAMESGEVGPLSSLGRPVPLADTRLVDDTLCDVPVGEPGELVVRGPHVMRGYWNRPEETADSLRDGWLFTGDVVRVDEGGFLNFVERKRDLIISGGFHVYAREVEAVLSAHPAVREAAVIGVPDDRWGEAVKAVVVPEPEISVSDAELIAWVKERKGSVLAPKTVVLVEKIPLDPKGKHDKSVLRALYRDNRSA